MKAVIRRLVLCAACIAVVVLPGCSDDDPARVERGRGFDFQVRVSDPTGAPLEGLRVAVASLLPCEFSVDCPVMTTSVPSRLGPQAAARLQFTLENESRVIIRINDRDGGHVRTLMDAAMQQGGVYNVVWDGRDDTGTHMPSGVYEICMVATDLGSGAVLFQPDCILVSLYTIVDMGIASDAVGHTGLDGRLRITSTLPFPYLYGDELTGYDADGAAIGTYSYTDEVSINVVDEGSGAAQRYIRTITDGTNHFDLVFDPAGGLAQAPPAPAPNPTPATTPVDPDQVTWSFGPLYPNPFN